MSVYMDQAGHLVADSREELHAFAAKIGLRREWFQDRPILWHYDLTTASKRTLARQHGAIPVKARTLVGVLKGVYLRDPERDTTGGAS